VEAGFSCPDIARAPPANAPPAATFFKNSRRSSFPFFFRVATIPLRLARVGATLVVAPRRQQRHPLHAYSQVQLKGIVIGQGREKGNY